MFRQRKIMTGVLAAACSLGLGAAAPTGAQADSKDIQGGYVSSGCSGSWIDGGSVGSHPTARWNLYYSSANGGTNCLVVHDNTAGSHYMEASVHPAGDYHTGAKDTGIFSTYAGGVNVTGMGGRCVGMHASIIDNWKTYTADIPSFHCG
ncbi:hypothetical protein [Kytococcus sp. Marseille-QA3725]